jgi:hypothetical protein
LLIAWVDYFILALVVGAIFAKDCWIKIEIQGTGGTLAKLYFDFFRLHSNILSVYCFIQWIY